LGEKCINYEVEGVRKLGVRFFKKTIIYDNYARKMLWTVGNGES